MTQFNKLLDVACGNHEHDWIPYYSLAKHTTSIDSNRLCAGREDSDDFYLLNLNNKNSLRIFGDQEFDIVLSDHTIEHLEQPQVFIKELQRVAKRLVIIKTPIGWQENIFKPLKLAKTSHLFHFSKKWFIQNTTPDFFISARSTTKIGLHRYSFIGEIIIQLRRFWL